MSNNQTLVSEQRLDVGGFKLSKGAVITTTPAYADLATLDMTLLGLIDKGDNVGLNFSQGKLAYEDGTPSGKVYEVVISEALKLDTMLSEIYYDTMVAAFKSAVAHVNGAVSTTVATDAGNTASKFKVASLTGISKNKMLKVGTEDPQLVKAIDSTAVTVELIQALSGTPAASTAVVSIQHSEFVIGGSATTEYYSLLMEKYMPVMEATLKILIPKANVVSEFSMAGEHDGKIKIPFGLEAVKQPNVLNGGLAKAFIIYK